MVSSQPSASFEAPPLRILHVENDPWDAELCRRELERSGFRVSCQVADTAERFSEALRAAHYDIVLADYSLPGWTGLDALEELQRSGRGFAVHSGDRNAGGGVGGAVH